MKKSYILFTLTLLTILFSLALIISEETQDQTSPQASLGEADKITGASEFKNSTNQILSEDIVVPENLQIIARIILGLKEGENLEFSTFIVLITLWIILLAIIHVILTLIPIFGEGWKSWAAATIVTILSTMTGAIKRISELFFEFGGYFQDQGLLRLISIIILLIAFSWGAIRLISLMKNKGNEEAAEIEGLRTGTGNRI